METYSFREFLDSVRDLNFIEMDLAALRRRDEMDRIATSRKRAKFDRDRAAHLASQIRGFRFWIATSWKPAGLSDEDFALIEPLCLTLVDKGQLKPEALNVFKKTARGG